MLSAALWWKCVESLEAFTFTRVVWTRVRDPCHSGTISWLRSGNSNVWLFHASPQLKWIALLLFGCLSCSFVPIQALPALYLTYCENTSTSNLRPIAEELFTIYVIDRHSPPRTSKHPQQRLRQTDSMSA